MVSLKQLEAFILVAEFNSFKQAAAKMHTTQPAISTRINNLEKELNTTLFYRDSGHVSLTDRGIDLLPLAQNIINSARQLHYQSDKKMALSGLVKIGVTETLAHAWIADFLNVINQQLPFIEIELNISSTSVLTKNLNDRNIDIAMTLGPINDPNIINNKLNDYPLTWVFHSNTNLNDKSEIRNFISKPIITYERNTLPFQELARYLRKNKIKVSKFYTFNSLSIALKLVMMGVGVALLPRYVVDREEREGLIKISNLDWTPTSLSFYAAYIDDLESGTKLMIIEKIIEIATSMADSN